MIQKLIKNNRKMQLQACLMAGKMTGSTFPLNIIRKYRSVKMGMQLPALVFAKLLKNVLVQKCIQSRQKEKLTNIVNLYLKVLPVEYLDKLLAGRDHPLSETFNTGVKAFYLKDQSRSKTNQINDKQTTHKRNLENNSTPRPYQFFNTIYKLLSHRPSMMRMKTKGSEIVPRSNNSIQIIKRALNDPETFYGKSQYESLPISNTLFTTVKNSGRDSAKKTPLGTALKDEPFMGVSHFKLKSVFMNSRVQAKQTGDQERFVNVKGDRLISDRTSATLTSLQPANEASPAVKSSSTTVHPAEPAAEFVLPLPSRDTSSTALVSKINQYQNNFVQSLINKSESSCFISKVAASTLLKGDIPYSSSNTQNFTCVKTNDRLTAGFNRSMLFKKEGMDFRNITDAPAIPLCSIFKSALFTQRSNSFSNIFFNNHNSKRKGADQVVNRRADHSDLELSPTNSLTPKRRKVEPHNNQNGIPLVYSEGSAVRDESPNISESFEPFKSSGSMANQLSDDNRNDLVSELFRKLPARQVSILADKVYQLIERKIFVEQDRRGFI